MSQTATAFDRGRTVLHPVPQAAASGVQAGRGPALFGLIVKLAVVMALAAILSVAGRTVTAALTDTLGQVWPFSLVQCRGPAPGCVGPTMPHGPTR